MLPLQNHDWAGRYPTKRGEYRIEWEESPDLAGSGKQQEKPTKTFTKVPADDSELSGEERKKWAAEAALAIRESLSRRTGGSDAPDQDRKSG